MKSDHDDKRMELTEHLGELRTRLIRCVWFLVISAFLAYQFFTPLYSFLYRPLNNQLGAINSKRIGLQLDKQHKEAVRTNSDPLDNIVIHEPPTKQDLESVVAAIRYVRQHPIVTPIVGDTFKNFYEPFTVRLQLSLIFGFILSTPLIVRELSLFILPALTPDERRPLRLLMPVSILLLMAGITVAYITMFYAMAWFLSYLDDFNQTTTLMQNPSDYIMFFVKMMAAFGFAFQLPVVLMAGAFVGIVTSEGLKKQWRWGVVIAVLGGLFTPSNDVISMALMSIPLLLLYFGSIYLVRIVEHMKSRDRFKPA